MWPKKSQVVLKVLSEIKLPRRGAACSPSPRHPLSRRGKPGSPGMVCGLLFPSQVTPSLLTLKRPRLPSKTVSNQVHAAPGVAKAAGGRMGVTVLF